MIDLGKRICYKVTHNRQDGRPMSVVKDLPPRERHPKVTSLAECAEA